MRPRASRPSEAQIKDKVHQLLDLVQLDWLGDRYPAQLSGGQRQRIALARALAVEPQVLLLDEPFGALDAKVRKELRRWLRRLHDELHVSSVFVTHDQEEALEVSDRVVLMNRGRIEQVGTPQAVWEQPASPFVFSFLGQVNRLQGHIEDGSLRIGKDQARIACPELHQAAPQQAGYAFVRPYELELRSDAAPGAGDATGWIKAQVLRVLAAGPLVRLEITPQDPSILPQGEVLEVHLGLQEFVAMPLRDADPVLLRPRGGRVFLV
jgi:sulfate transport system ATP-binding protein